MRVREGRLGVAINDLDKAISLNPAYAEAYAYRGLAKLKNGDPAAAVADFDTAIKLNPRDTVALNSRGIAKDQLGQRFEAIADFRRAIDLDPGDANSYYNRAFTIMKLGGASYAFEAKKDIEKYLQLGGERKSEVDRLLKDIKEEEEKLWQDVKELYTDLPSSQSQTSAETDASRAAGQGLSGPAAPESPQQLATLLARAEAGNIEAQYTLGVRYTESGPYSEAAKWFRRAADRGDARAQCELGFLYSRGLGVQRDDKQAVYWFRRSAEKGYANGQFNLATMYQQDRTGGESILASQEKLDEMLKWYRSAARQGYAPAMYNLGTNLVNSPFPEYQKEGEMWLQKYRETKK